MKHRSQTNNKDFIIIVQLSKKDEKRFFSALDLSVKQIFEFPSANSNLEAIQQNVLVEI